MNRMDAAETEKAFSGRRQPRQGEALELDLIAVGEGLSITCRWAHSRGRVRQCGGALWLRKHARQNGYRASAYCDDGTLYVWKRGKKDT